MVWERGRWIPLKGPRGSTGKIWVTNDTDSQQIFQEDLISFETQGWHRGRTMEPFRKQGKSYWINNGTDSKMLRETKAKEFVATGCWVYGRLPLTK